MRTPDGLPPLSYRLRQDAEQLVRGAMFSPQVWRAMADEAEAMEKAIERVRRVIEKWDGDSAWWYRGEVDDALNNEGDCPDCGHRRDQHAGGTCHAGS